MSSRTLGGAIAGAGGGTMGPSGAAGSAGAAGARKASMTSSSLWGANGASMAQHGELRHPPSTADPQKLTLLRGIKSDAAISTLGLLANTCEVK